MRKLKTISSNDKYLLAELGSQQLENVIDAISSAKFDILDNVPAVKVVTTIYKINKSWQERNFLNKIIYFLYTCKSLAKEDVQEFLNKNVYSDKESFGNRILILLDKADSIVKSKILSRLYISAVENKIDLAKFNRLSDCVIRGNIEDFRFLLKFKNSKRDTRNPRLGIEYYNLSLIGLSYRYSSLSGNEELEKTPHRLTDYAFDLLEYGLYSSDF